MCVRSGVVFYSWCEHGQCVYVQVLYSTLGVSTVNVLTQTVFVTCGMCLQDEG